MPNTARRYTVDEVLAFPADGKRYEVVAGELLVTPAPSVVHQIVVGRLYDSLNGYLAATARRAQVFFAPADITWSDDKLVQPDVFVVPHAEVTRDWRSCKTLLLAAEVLSPRSARADRVVKRRLYQAHGVGTYWCVDIDAAMVEVWQPADDRPEIVTDALRWAVAPDAPPLILDLGTIFGDLPD